MTTNLIILFLIQVLISLTVIKLSIKFKFLDYPNNRKIHAYPTPFTGGIILSTTYICINFFLIKDVYIFNLIILNGFLISFFILFDDIYNFNALNKFVLQLICVLILVFNNIILNDIGYYDLFGKISLGKFNLIFSILCILLLINAFNYTDGIDGLASSICIIIFLNNYLVINLFYPNLIILSQYFLLYAASLFIFLFFNFGLINKQKIFLGDCGSNFLGLVSGGFTIILFSDYDIHPTLLIWPLAYIIFEFLYINIYRIKKLKNLFLAGHDHLHYLISKKFNLSKIITLIIILSVNLIFCFLGLLFHHLAGPSYSLILFVVFFILYSFIRYKAFN